MIVILKTMILAATLYFLPIKKTSVSYDMFDITHDIFQEFLNMTYVGKLYSDSVKFSMKPCAIINNKYAVSKIRTHRYEKNKS